MCHDIAKLQRLTVLNCYPLKKRFWTDKLLLFFEEYRFYWTSDSRVLSYIIKIKVSMFDVIVTALFTESVFCWTRIKNLCLIDITFLPFFELRKNAQLIHWSSVPSVQWFAIDMQFGNIHFIGLLIPESCHT